MPHDPAADRLLDGLDPEQRRAATAPPGPLVILAGAGSGKTRVLTRRIAHRCLTGSADPRFVLALTFTRRAAEELRSRLGALGLAESPTAGTFHGVAYAQLRGWWASTGRREPALLDRKGRLVARLLPDKKLSVADAVAELEWAAARGVAPDDYAVEAAAAGRTPPAPPTVVADLYRRYEQEKRHKGLVDFDDLLTLCARALEADPEFAAAQRWRFRHLFVDEYQDVNPIQHRLLRAWLGDRDDLCVVGDPNQAIYRWNGADAGFLTGFATEFPGARTVSLAHNHRSNPAVVAVALAALPQSDGPVATTRPTGPTPVVTAADDDEAEAVSVARALRDHHRPGRPWSDQAVLVRTNAQTALIEQTLRRARIPYRVRGAARFTDRPAVREALRGARVSRAPLRMWLADLDASLETERADLAAGGDRPDRSAVERVESLDTLVRLGHDLLGLEPDAPASSFPGWLATNVQEDDDRPADAVDIASFHASKGLEWKVVHVAGVEDGYVPISHAGDRAARAEERRLLYVAMSRAEDVLRVSWARRRTFGTRVVDRSPSPWLMDVEDAVARQRRQAQGAAPSVRARHVAEALASLGDDRSAPEPTAGTGAVERSLRTWRKAAARAAGVPESVVLPDRVLARLALDRPTDLEGLAAVPGLGRVKAGRYEAELLAALYPRPDRTEPCASR